MKKRILFILLGILLCLSCKEEKRVRSEQIVKEWIGKTVRLPSGVETYDPRSDSAAAIATDTDYKILLYTDSVGCTSCKLKPFLWSRFIEEVDSLRPGRTAFLFYFQPKNPKELFFILKRDGFRHPVFIDKGNEIDRLNHFPREMEFQCFLLDKENKVLSIGNPVLNPRIGALYKQIITGSEVTPPTVPSTTLTVDQPQKELIGLKKGQTTSASFILTNTGEQPLVITLVDASCGCTVPTWEKKPVPSGKQTEIKVNVTPEETGFFQKAVTVHCNVKEQPVILKLSGKVE